MKCFSLILGAIIVLFGATVMAAPQINASNKIDFTSPSKAILVKSTSPEFNITVQSNPSTGYSWFLKSYDSLLMKVISHKYVAPTSKLMGAPGYEVWMFKMLPQAFEIPSTTEVTLIYARPWEKNTGEKSVFRIFTIK